jgi:hypothetical protein
LSHLRGDGGGGIVIEVYHVANSVKGAWRKIKGVRQKASNGP